MNDRDLKKMQYAQRTWHFDLPDPMEQKLENDYVTNSDLYTDDMLRKIQMLYVLIPNITPCEMVNWVHCQEKKTKRNQ